MGDGCKPVIRGKHTVHILLACYFVISSIGIHADKQVLENITLIVDATCIALQSCIDDDTILTLIAAADTVARDLVTSYS